MIHAAETYGKYLALNGHDDKILEILNDVTLMYEAIEVLK